MQYYSSDTGHATAPFMGEVHGCGDPADSWSSNSLRFDTAEEAKQYLLDLSGRWFGIDRWRVIEVRMSDLLKAKKAGTDCTEDDSAYIKRWLNDTVINPTYNQSYVIEDIQECFPLEYDEAIDEIENSFGGYEK